MCLRKTTILLLISFLFLIPTTAWAQSDSEEEQQVPSLTITPSILDLDVEKKEKFKEVIKIINNSDFPLPVKVDVNDYTVDEEGVPDYSEDPTEWSPKGWIEVKPADLILEPLGSREITLKVSVPKSALPGSHFATILFKPVLPPEYFEKDSAHVIPYIGAVVALNVAGEELLSRQDYLKIQEFLRGESKEEESQEEFYSKVQNEDIYYHKVSGNIIIWDIFNREVAVKSIDEITLFPESMRSLTSLLGSDLPFGRYRAHLYLSDKKLEVSKNLVFWERPTGWEIIFFFLRVIFLIVILGVITLIILKRKNLKGALKTLFARKK